MLLFNGRSKPIRIRAEAIGISAVGVFPLAFLIYWPVPD